MIYERIKYLSKKRGISINKLEGELDVAKGYLSKIDRVKPSNERLTSIANYFGVSLEYLTTGKESAEKPEIPEYDKETMELIILFSKLKKEQKSAILNMMRSFALEN